MEKPDTRAPRRCVGASPRSHALNPQSTWRQHRSPRDNTKTAAAGGQAWRKRRARSNTSSSVREARGEDRNIWIHVPIGYAKLFSDARHNWLYSSEPEPELGGRSIIQPRGKVLGGSSSINGLLYIRGQAEDFDHWRQLGNAGWSFADVLPYFRRAEDQQRGEDALHGVGGPLAVRDVSEPHPLCEAFIEACEQAGLPRTNDFNGPDQEGAGYFQLTTRKGRRWSTAPSWSGQIGRAHV